MNKLYMVASTVNEKNSNVQKIFPMIITHADKNTAIGQAYTYIQTFFPVSKGYYNHYVTATEVDLETLTYIYNNVIKPLIEEGVIKNV